MSWFCRCWSQIFFRVSKTGITAIAPPYTWGKSGNNSSGTYLLNDTVPSNITGRVIPTSGVLYSLSVACEDSTTGDIKLQKRSGASFSDLATISLSSERVKTTYYTGVSISKDDELCMVISSGSFKNLVVSMIMKEN